MAKDKGKEAQVPREEIHELCLVGSYEAATVQALLQGSPAPPSVECARLMALAILSGRIGRYQTSNHFKDQMAERGFDVFDVEYAIRNGETTEDGEYSEEHRDFKYCFRCNIDGTDFDAVFSFSALHDLDKCPLMILITGVWKTKTGKRKKTF